MACAMTKPPRIDRIFPGIGRINLSSGTRTVGERNKRDAMLTELYGNMARHDILSAIKDGRLTINGVYAAYRTGNLGTVLADVQLAQSLTESVERWLPSSAKAPRTRERYGCSWKQFQAKGVLPPSAKVSDLAAVNWDATRGLWEGEHDWKHLRGFISHFLTQVCGDLFHPFRRSVVKRIPVARPKGRMPDVSPDAFWLAVSFMPQHTAPGPVAILATSMRVGELCSRTEHDLMPLTKGVRVVGNKPPYKEAVYAIDPRFWPWVKRAIPFPVSHWTLRDHWRTACAKAGLKDVTLHDLRHVGPQWLHDDGVSTAHLQTWLRHETPASTAIYTAQKLRADLSSRLADKAMAKRAKRRGKKA